LHTIITSEQEEMSSTNTIINPNPAIIIVVLEYIGIPQKMHTLKYLQRKSIIVQIGPTMVNQLQIILQQLPTINQITIINLQNNNNQNPKCLIH
jgi:hypothetical protein